MESMEKLYAKLHDKQKQINLTECTEHSVVRAGKKACQSRKSLTAFYFHKRLYLNTLHSKFQTLNCSYKIRIQCKSWMGQTLTSQLKLGIPRLAEHPVACRSWTYCTCTGVSREVPLLFLQISPGNLLCCFHSHIIRNKT